MLEVILSLNKEKTQNQIPIALENLLDSQIGID
jgi:hypothetical protein